MRRAAPGSLAAAVVAVLVVIGVAVPLTDIAPSIAGAAVLGGTVSYNPAYTTTMVQTFTISGNANSPGGDGTYQLTDGVHTTAPISYQADLATFVAALDGAGLTVSDAFGGSGEPGWTGAGRWTVTFAVDPGVLLSAVNVQFVYLYKGATYAGAFGADCVYCLDVYAPTGPANGAALILVHVGGLINGTKDNADLAKAMDPYRAAGYTTVLVNHRLAPAPQAGTYTCKIDTVFPPDSPCDRYIKGADLAAADVQMATQWLTDNAATYGLVPGKVAALGLSSGGTVAAHSVYLPAPPGRRRPLAAVDVGGPVRDALMTAGAPPLFIGAFSADPGIIYTGTDTFQEGQDAIARSRAVGDYVEVRAWMGPGHIPTFTTLPGSRDTSPEAADLETQSLAFLAASLFGGPRRPSSQWFGAVPPYGLPRATSNISLFERPTEDVRAITGDFDGNGIEDIFWYGVGPFPDTLWIGRSDGTFTDAVEVIDPDTGLPGFVPIVDQRGAYPNVAVGDFDGNGRDDLIFGGGGLTPQLWRFGFKGLNRPTISTPAAPVDPADVPVAGDFDGDHLADVAWVGTGAAPSYLWYGTADGAFADSGGSLSSSGVANPPSGAVAKAGDFDGDGRRDVIWHAAGSATAETAWWGADRAARLVATAVAVPGTSWDTGTASFVEPGDFDGDGRTDLLVVGNGLAPDTLVHGTTDRAGTRQAFGWLGTATPVVGDFNGDGRADVFWYSSGASIGALWYGGVAGFSTTTVAVGRTGTPLVGRFDGYPGYPARTRSDLFWRRG